MRLWGADGSSAQASELAVHAGSPRSRRRWARSWLHTPTLVSGRGCGEPGHQPEELAADRAQGGSCPTPPRPARSGSAAKNSSLGREDPCLGQEFFRSHLVRFNPGIPDAELAHDRPPCSKAVTRSTPGVKGNRDANERLRVDSATCRSTPGGSAGWPLAKAKSATGEREPTRDAGQSRPRPCWASYRARLGASLRRRAAARKRKVVDDPGTVRVPSSALKSLRAHLHGTRRRLGEPRRLD
jgi:hypothetical protein